MIKHTYKVAPYIKDAIARDGIFHVINTNVAYSIVKSDDKDGYTAHYFLVKDGEVQFRSIDVKDIDEKILSMLDHVEYSEVSYAKNPIDGYSNFTESPYNVHEIFQCVRLIYSKFLHMRTHTYKDKPYSALITGVLPSCEESEIDVTFEDCKKLNVNFKYTFVTRLVVDDKAKYFENKFSAESGMVDVFDMYFIPKIVHMFIKTIEHFNANKEAQLKP
jgi:hypothetical protein